MDPNDTNTPPVDELLSALDAGIAAADTPASITPPAEPAAAVVEPPVAPVVDSNAAAPVPGTEEARAAEEAAAAAAAAAAAPPADPNAAPPKAGDTPPAVEPDAAVEQEIKDLKLGDKATERFRSMAAEIKELAPIKEQLAKAGVTDIAQLPKMIERSQAADKMIEMVMDTGATSEQYGKSLDYLALVNRAGQGDRTAGEAAFKAIGEEYAALAKALGKPVPGVYDPLADHPDLQAEVESEDLTPERALEIAVQRNAAIAQRQTQEQGQQTRAQEQAVERGRSALAEFDASMRASDPSYMARRDTLSAQVAEIRTKFPPEQWVSQAALALAKIPVPAAAASPAPPVVTATTPAARPPPGPMRPGAQRPPLAPVTDDPFEAMEQGIAAASGL